MDKGRAESRDPMVYHQLWGLLEGVHVLVRVGNKIQLDYLPTFGEKDQTVLKLLRVNIA